MELLQRGADAPEVIERERLIRLPEVERITGIRKSTIYALSAQTPPAFPRGVRVSPRCVAWPLSAINRWVQERISGGKS